MKGHPAFCSLSVVGFVFIRHQIVENRLKQEGTTWTRFLLLETFSIVCPNEHNPATRKTRVLSNSMDNGASEHHVCIGGMDQDSDY